MCSIVCPPGRRVASGMEGTHSSANLHRSYTRGLRTWRLSVRILSDSRPTPPTVVDREKSKRMSLVARSHACMEPYSSLPD